MQHPTGMQRRKAEETANQCAKTAKELSEKIQKLRNSILDFSPAEKNAQIQAQIEVLKDEITQIQSEEQRQREIFKDEQAKGDAIYWGDL
jgi:type I restriction enzyme M protein